jgi:UDP-N-acetylglucosamine 3-dehydrogenase
MLGKQKSATEGGIDMAPYRVGIIGCGRKPDKPGPTGYGMGHAHALGYAASPDAAIVALADIVLENAEAFREQHGGDAIYQDYGEMLAREDLDIVSITTWPHLHADMVVAAAEAGVKAVHCEKPMALTFGDAKRMVAACEANGVQLTYNHQRRFAPVFQTARRLVDEAAIGQVQVIHGVCANLFDWGTHWFDMINYLNNECDVAWVLGQVDLRGSHRVFGAPIEGQGLSYYAYQNGVYGMLTTGYGMPSGGWIELTGSEGRIEIGRDPSHPLRIWAQGDADWRAVPVEGGLHGQDYIVAAILDLIDALKTGREPMLSGRRALRATELIFATYESSRRRGRVDLPLEIDDSPLMAMLAEQGLEPA